MKSLVKFAIFLITISVFSQKNNPHFTLKPTLTPDGSTVIFSYQGDLWKVASSGGDAFRLTAMDGTETNPSVSPDGKYLAFSSNQYGNNDIYLMSLNGGEIKQLTFHEANDRVTSWSWDSKTINFDSNRENSISNYTISKDGGTPIRKFPHYFNTVHHVVQHPKTKDFYFNETWESFRFAHRKRYIGDYNPDIKSYNVTTQKFTKHTSYRGKDFGATIDKNGTVYFKSDEYKGEYNLYTFKDGKKKRLTNFSTSIMWPKVSADGNKIVFRKDYQIYVYDIASNSAKKLKININTNSTVDKNQAYNVKGNITFFDVSPDGKKMAFVSRGKLFVSDVKGKFVKEIPTNVLEAISEVKWLKDNKTLLFSRSYKGYYNWFTVDVTNPSKKKQLTKNMMNNRQITFNKDLTKGVYLRGRNEIHTIDLKTYKSELVVEDELWGFYNANPYFSPDDKYIVYNAYRDFEADIFVYNIASKRIINLTNTKVSEFGPIWSADGKYLYFSSERTSPNFPSGGNGNSKIYQMALDKYEKPFKMEKVNQLFAKKDTAKKSKKETVTTTINSNGLMDRLTRISPWFGNQRNISVIKDGTKTHVLYTSNHDEGQSKLWKTTLEPFENNKTVKLGDKRIFGYQYVTSKKKHYVLVRGAIHSLNLGANKLKPIAINYNFNKSLSDEFEQMYFEAWAGMEENFYDENFHGENWQKLRDSYAKYLSFVTNRAELRLIFNDMLGELNTSHFGFNSNGAEEKIYYGTRTLATGIVFENQNPYIVKRIVKESPVDVKGKNIRKGDELIAVNDIKIDKSRNRASYFTNPKFQSEIKLTFSRNKEKYDVFIHTTSYRGINSLVYDEWQDENQNYVDKKSNNQIAYVHMKNMGRGELTKFYEDLMSDEAYKKGLILDLRYNTGGNVHDAVLNFLQQKQYLNWKYREGKLASQSNFSYGNKPIVLLINEQSLSDAEMTAAGFKELGLGTIVGTETYRWIIFTTGSSLVDGSFYRLPSWGCYTLDGKDLEINGVAPDVYVGKNFKDRLENNTPQLDKAIEIIMKKIK
ncbi:S41 family peptidase [Polaribacter porphyrae]|uniref:Tricorn protease homolog n=1 Tax=Polaribacter porphyrae TaxID=1137780 RepID=A0A2S7WL99_9FLAO|nr:S41 family peptidase [Polaribacter porphyrae]PQJ78385.1 peptidase S41 [Polaribacter porphyrae]